jgi:hypothetical protein
VRRQKRAVRIAAGVEETMPQTYLLFDFGSNEEAAQQARHRIEAWRQAFRLGDRVQFKFERIESDKPAAAAPEAELAKSTKKKGKKAKEAEPAPAASAPDHLHLLVRLEFSDHEKLTHQRWLDRIPAEPPFQTAEKQVVRRGQAGFDEAVKRFDELD